MRRARGHRYGDGAGAGAGDAGHAGEEIPLGRLGRPDEIAAAIAYLACDATYATGQVLTLDGGFVELNNVNRTASYRPFCVLQRMKNRRVLNPLPRSLPQAPSALLSAPSYMFFDRLNSLGAPHRGPIYFKVTISNFRADQYATPMDRYLAGLPRQAQTSPEASPARRDATRGHPAFSLHVQLALQVAAPHGLDETAVAHLRRLGLHQRVRRVRVCSSRLLLATLAYSPCAPRQRSWMRSATSLSATDVSPLSRRTAMHTPFSMSLGPSSMRIGTPFISYCAHFQPRELSLVSIFTHARGLETVEQLLRLLDDAGLVRDGRPQPAPARSTA